MFITNQFERELRYKLEDADASILEKLQICLTAAAAPMLPLLTGGILIAFAYFFDDYRINPAEFGGNYPFVKFFKDLGVDAFRLMLIVFPACLSMAIAGRKGITAGLVAGLIAVQGNSGLFGALLSGYAAGFSMVWLSRRMQLLPPRIRIHRPIFEAALGILVSGFLTLFVILPPLQSTGGWLVEFIQKGMVMHPVLTGALAAALTAMDFGGPFSKSAYLAGLTLLYSNSFTLMAAVMAGSMIAPLAIALSTSVYRFHFTREERRFAPVCLLLGLAGISEGVLPFAAASPITIPIGCMLGAAVGGALSVALGCTVYIPFGGIFAITTIGGVLPFFLSVLLGTIVSTFLIQKMRQI